VFGKDAAFFQRHFQGAADDGEITFAETGPNKGVVGFSTDMKTQSTLSKRATGQFHGLSVRRLTPRQLVEIDALKKQENHRRMAREIYAGFVAAMGEAAAVHPGLFRDGI